MTDVEVNAINIGIADEFRVVIDRNVVQAIDMALAMIIVQQLTVSVWS